MNRGQKTVSEMFNRARKQDREKIERDETAIALRCQMLWAFSLEQLGYTPEQINEARKMAAEIAAEKYDDLKIDGVADECLWQQLHDRGINFAKIPPDVSFDF